VDAVTDAIIGACIEVHRALGPGLLESTYEECVALEFIQRGLVFARQVALPVNYKGRRLNCDYRLDFVVLDQVVVELKAVDQLLPIHEAQVLTYLKLGGWQVGLLVNFNVPVLCRGLRRLVFRLPDPAEAAPSAPVR
jgi:GxxExxY protein